MKLKVEAIRKQLGMTQEELAKILGITPTTYALKEKKIREFKGSELVKISKLANISLDEIEII